MMTLSKPRYPQGFTFLVAEVADAAMRAMQQADPYAYLETRAKAEAIAQARMHRGITAEDHSDPVQRRRFRLEIVHNKIVRDLALQVIASYDRLERLGGGRLNGSCAVPMPRPAAVNE